MGCECVERTIARENDPCDRRIERPWQGHRRLCGKRRGALDFNCADKEKLNQLKEVLEEQFATEVIVFPFDLSRYHELPARFMKYSRELPLMYLSIMQEWESLKPCRI